MSTFDAGVVVTILVAIITGAMAYGRLQNKVDEMARELEKTDREQWNKINETIRWQFSHEKETADKREFILGQINNNATAIVRVGMQTDTLAKSVEEIKETMKSMDHKLDRLMLKD